MSTNLLAPPSSLQDGVSATGTSLQLIDTAAAALLALPTDSSAVAPTLQTDMLAAQALATEWNTSVRAGVVNTLNGIISYNSLFANEFNTLYQTSVQIADDDSSAIPTFQAELQKLYNATLQESQAVDQVQQSLISYNAAVTSSEQALNTDATQLQSAVSTEQYEISELQQANDYLEGEEQEVYWDIIKNQGHPVMQELQIMMDELEQKIQKINDQLNTVSNQLYADQQQLADLQKDLNDLGGYLTDLGQLQGGITSLANGWEALSGDYENLLADEDIESYSVFTPDDVEAAARDWAELAQLTASFI